MRDFDGTSAAIGALLKNRGVNSNAKDNIMKVSTVTIQSIIAAFTLCATVNSEAASITLGGPLPPNRTATLSSAVNGATGTGNATAVDVEAAFGGDWTGRGTIDPASGGPGAYSGGLLDLTIVSGSWGGKTVSGTWAINDPTFWDDHKDAAISIHVGNGQSVEPDHFIWFLTEDLFSGTWSYNGAGLQGGGLSNMKLYSRGEGDGINPPRGNPVPDGGATAAMLGIGSLALGAARKFKK